MTKFNKLITLSSVALLASVSPQLTFADTTSPASTDVPAVVAPNSEPSTVPSSDTEVPAVVAPNSESTTVPSSDTDVPAVSTTPSETTSEQETPSPIAPSDPSSNVPTTSSDSNEVKPSLANSATTNPVTDATTNSSDKDKVDTQTTPSEKKEDTDKDKKVEVPTIDGGTASLKPDVTVPTNNPNVSAQTAVDAGASQVGTTSQITGQVVEEVTPQAPVQTNTGASIISTKDGNVVLSDGSVVAPEEVGGTVNEDKTISVTDKDGKLKTLPNTGLKESILLTFAGFGLLAIVMSFFLKKRSN
ncbi:LPXTG cell wall anchor domain-containing protein [Streptococcus sinensis]|uniref:LPXTG cell wall anchor domain-containing protein n=1 Tax=Streptococcus sinensis TaxID=176090 RepID=UPI001F3E91B1|nr:LPXTG cell wall anchor domain-containing protein [Streptococcus sinensis]MCF1284827.1 LPXTG cell wall anchor domain-containing protein [Streptococcus sinensis]